ncbi:MAG: class I SAM-dependent methyltransferase [Propionibacteriaceae bacterium]|nr:class I SAM-dependent methyltransferase [Propionibacteriaceae bacterium]
MATARGRRAFSLAFRPARRGSRQTERFSWNHNSAYYPWVAKAALARQPAVLDVGCGDGSLLAALAPFCCNIIGIDSAPAAVKKAWPRTVAAVNASVVKGDFLAHDFAGKRFHLICFVASLHHMEAKSALDKAKGLLQPGGELRIVALAANGRLGDWLLDMLTWPLARLMGLLKGESQDPAMRTARPTQTHAELRRTVKAMLPGCHVRRGLYYRDLIRWTKPE